MISMLSASDFRMWRHNRLHQGLALSCQVGWQEHELPLRQAALCVRFSSSDLPVKVLRVEKAGGLEACDKASSVCKSAHAGQ